MNRRSIFSLIAASAVATGGVLATALVTPAAAQLDIRIGMALPTPIYEPVPMPRPGYVWSPGSWIWNANRFTWRSGHWLPARAGYRYVPERWEPYWESGRQQWRHVASRWDRDGDGIPNRYDRTPNPPQLADRDRDGVPDRYDRHDRNAWRW